MLQNLVAGTIVIALTVVIHTFGLIAVTRVMAWMTARFRMNGRRSRVLAMITVVFGLFAIMTVEVWVWAAAFVLTGSFDDFATALYFSCGCRRADAKAWHMFADSRHLCSSDGRT